VSKLACEKNSLSKASLHCFVRGKTFFPTPVGNLSAPEVVNPTRLQLVCEYWFLGFGSIVPGRVVFVIGEIKNHEKVPLVRLVIFS
jgi:hypothetical protein